MITGYHELLRKKAKKKKSKGEKKEYEMVIR